MRGDNNLGMNPIRGGDSVKSMATLDITPGKVTAAKGGISSMDSSRFVES